MKGNRDPNLAFIDPSTEMAGRIQRFDWSGSPLGPPVSWPAPLRSTLDLILASRFPMAVLWGRELRYLYNDAYIPILGARHPAALGAPFPAAWPELRATLLPIVENAYAGQSLFFENMALTVERDGRPEPASFTFAYSPLRADDGAIGGVLCVCTETTGPSARDAERHKDEFLAMLVHELRNPLAPIASAAEMLRMAPHDELRIRAVAGIVARQTNHMTRLLDDLLDVTRVTRGQVTLKKQALDMHAVLSEAAEQVRPLIATHKHTLSIRAEPGLGKVYGDRTRLVQMAANLLGNAAKYTPEGGRIDVVLIREDEEIVCTVHDNGPGIAPELLPRIFDLFGQVRSGADRAQAGLGLGLALVRSLVELHGGQVNAASDGPGKGCSFSFRLPCAANAGARPRADAATDGACKLRLQTADKDADAA